MIENGWFDWLMFAFDWKLVVWLANVCKGLKIVGLIGQCLHMIENGWFEWLMFANEWKWLVWLALMFAFDWKWVVWLANVCKGLKMVGLIGWCL